ncbi:helix-turn-helix domain-containing protein [Hymenobacter sp. PAMC 26628]|uniref:helix-turn-helix domain-containing protein n=1 Tax=Hymenobacter sp. PAMC 26628 TaxID=1484118 RepID=UPI0009020594
MHNPFENLSTRLTNLETLALQILEKLGSNTENVAHIGGIELAQEITRLSKARLYALVSARRIPHSKRGQRLYFDRAELLAWIQAGKRAQNETAACI